MVATSANARATSASRSPIGDSSILKRFKAPVAVSRSEAVARAPIGIRQQLPLSRNGAKARIPVEGSR